MSALDRLRTIAEQATPGRWECRRLEGTHGHRTVNQVASDGYGTLALLGEGEASDADTAFMTAFDPVMVVALLDVAEAAARVTGGTTTVELADALDRLREVTP